MYSERASIYEIEYLESRDASFLKGLITNDDQSSVLEIPCGAGRLSVQLAECVSRYVVADLEEDMVRVAKRRLCEEKKLSHVAAHVADMCNLNFNEKFDWIIVPREALQLIHPNSIASVLKNLCKHLKNHHSRLVIDLAHFSVAGDPDYYYPQIAEKKWHKNWERIDKLGQCLTRWSYQVESESSIEFFLRYLKKDNVGNSIKFDSKMTLYKFCNKFIEKKMPEEFKVYHLYGDYNNHLYECGGNRSIYIIGKK